MTNIGKVYLVGGGPGDPDLLTVKALRLIQGADVVVYDRLISRAILDLVPNGVLRICVGKTPGEHNLPQQEINELLVSLARRRRTVIRLKGGDPFVFGRGGEEALHLRRRGIDFEVVPGITAAVACSAYAGVPLTHRGISRSVRFVTGHFKDDEPIELHWSSLADPDTTLVIYMGHAHLEGICVRLLAEGLDPVTPALAIQDGTMPWQQRVFARLGTLADRVQGAKLQPPILIIIGQTVALSDALDWFQPAMGSQDAALDCLTGA